MSNKPTMAAEGGSGVPLPFFTAPYPPRAYTWAGTPIWKVGNGSLRIEGATLDPRHEDDLGTIVIGGDLGDVYACAAVQDGDAVVLFGVEFRSHLDNTFKKGLSPEQAADLAAGVVAVSYASIGADTFVPM